MQDNKRDLEAINTTLEIAGKHIEELESASLMQAKKSLIIVLKALYAVIADNIAHEVRNKEKFEKIAGALTAAMTDGSEAA